MWLVLAVALVARLLYWRFVIPDYGPASDDAQYMEIALHLVNGEGFSQYFPNIVLHPTAFRPPLYPLLLAGVWSISGGPSIVTGQLLNLVLGLAVVGLTFRLGLRLGGDKAALISGLVVALFPPLMANDLVLLTEPLSLALLLGAMLALLNRYWVLAGALAGLLVLTRPSAQLFVLVLVAWVVLQPAPWRSRVGRGAVVGVVAVAVVAPWIVRNAVVMGAPVLVTSNGFNAAAIYSPQAMASDGFVDPVRDARFEDYRLDQFDEVLWQERLQELAVDNARDNPRYVVHVLRRNLLGYLEVPPQYELSAERADGRNLTFRAWTLPLFYVNTVLGMIGLWRLRARREAQLIALVATYFLLSSLVFVSWPRVRAPFDLMLCLGTGALLASWYCLRPRRWGSPLTAGWQPPEG